MADFLECLECKGTDVDRLGGDTQVFHQCQRIGPGPLCRAEAGHGQAVDQPPVEAEHVTRGDRNKERERGIEASGDSEIEWRVPGEVLDSLGQAGALDAEDLGAAAVELRAFRWYERRARNVALQAVHGSRQRERNDAEWFHIGRAVIEAGRDTAIGEQLGDVDVPGDRVRVAADRLAVSDSGRLGQESAVLGDQAMAAENDVGG